MMEDIWLGQVQEKVTGPVPEVPAAHDPGQSYPASQPTGPCGSGRSPKCTMGRVGHSGPAD